MPTEPDLPRRRCARFGLAALAHAAAAPGRSRTGARPGAVRSAGPPNGTSMLVGGGEIGPEIAAEARRLDGGADAEWVVVPTAAEDADVEASGRSGFVSGLGHRFAVLHTRDRAVSDTPALRRLCARRPRSGSTEAAKPG